MGNLIGPRRDDGVLHAIELALVAERLARPSAADDLQRLAEARLALGVRHAVNVVRAHDAAAPDAELEAPFADVIDGGDLFGDAQRMIQRQHLHGGADADPARAAGDGAGHLQRGRDHRARGREVDLAEPDAIDAEGVGALGGVEDVAEGRGLRRPLTHLFHEEPDVHGLHCRTAPRTVNVTCRAAAHRAVLTTSAKADNVRPL